jgi:predicted Zn-dependent peptidase
MHLARSVLSSAVERLDESEVQRARAQLEAGLLMALETAQGRADQMARSIEVHGRIQTLDEVLGELRAVDVAAARSAGLAAIDGRAAIASVGAQLALAA